MPNQFGEGNNVLSRQRAFLKAMFEGQQPWIQITPFFIEKECTNHVKTNIVSSRWCVVNRDKQA